jgi:hypothetical protein
MPIGQTRSFTINSEGEADYCLKELFKIPGYRSMDVVNMNAQAYIANPRIKEYFVKKAKEILKTYDES